MDPGLPVNDLSGCPSEPQQQQQQQLFSDSSPSQTDAFLTAVRCQKSLVDELSDDREVQAICLPDGSSDEDSDGLLIGSGPCPGRDSQLDRGTNSALVLIESTSSSPVLNGSAQSVVSAHEDQVATTTNSDWRVVNRVFCVGREEITVSTPDDAEEEEDGGGDGDAQGEVQCGEIVSVLAEGGNAEEEEEEGEKAEVKKKSGFSRCVSSNLAVTADADGSTGGNGGGTSSVEWTDGKRVNGGDEDGTCLKVGNRGTVEKVAVAEDGADANDECSSCDGGDVEDELFASGNDKSTRGHCDHAIRKLNGVQSEQATQTKVTIECESVRRITTTTTSSSSSLSSTSSCLSPSSGVVGLRKPSSNAGDVVGVDSAAAKQQTPTSSVRTGSQVLLPGGGGSYGKSELQLENPKILSKRLQRLFQFGAEDGDLVDDHPVLPQSMQLVSNEDVANAENVVAEVVVGGEGEVKDSLVARDKIASPTVGMDTNETSSRVVSLEETPSTSMSASLNAVREAKEEPEIEEEPREEGADVAEMEEEEEEVDHDEDEDDDVDHEPVAATTRRRDQEGRNAFAVALPSASSVADNAQALQQRQQQQGTVQQPGDFDGDTWADCEEVGDESEEICTCQNYSDTEECYDEDEHLPSKDVDLSGFTTHELLQDSHAESGGSGTGGGGGAGVASPSVAGVPSIVTTPVGPGSGRKRKMSESLLLNGGESPSTSSSSLVPLYGLDGLQSKRSRGTSKYGTSLGSPKTPTSSSTSMAIPAYLRTPRSAQGMHMQPKEHLPVEMNSWLVQFQKWTEGDRVTALNHIIDICEPSQVRHVMKVIEPQFQRDFISLLPRELALQVLSYLEPTDLLRAAQTCRNWRFLCDDNLLWKDKCKEGNIIIDVVSDRPKRGRAGNMPPIASPWKAAYMRQHIIELNWRTRPIRPPKVLKGHDDHVITCLQFCGNRIVSGSDDNTLKVWSAVTGKCLRVLVGHTGGVWSSQMSSKYIISGSTDRSLKVWNAETGHCEHTLYGHTSTVRCMHLHGEKVVSGSRDATLRVWDVNRGTCLHVLVGHLAAVRCVQYDGKLVVSGAYDYTVKVWNPERQECLHTLQGHTNRVYSLQFDGIHVVSGSLDTSIRVWDAETGSCRHTLMGHQSLTSGMELRDNILVSGNADSTVKIWDIVSGQCLQTLSGPNKHQSAVTCLQFNSRFVITSSDDGTVKLWDVKTGDFIRNLVALESGGSGGVVWRIRASDTKLICAVGSRNGTEETKLMVLDFDVEGACLKCS